MNMQVYNEVHSAQDDQLMNMHVYNEVRHLLPLPGSIRVGDVILLWIDVLNARRINVRHPNPSDRRSQP